MVVSTLHLTYKQACTTVHANSKGNIERLGYKPSLHIIDTSPTEKGHGKPLWFATVSFMYVVAVLCENLGIDFKKYKEPLNDLIVFYSKQQQNEISNN